MIVTDAEYDDLLQGFYESFYEYNRVEIRDVEAGEHPFLYTTGNKGPGFVDVKGGVGIDDFMERGVLLLALKLIQKGIQIDAVVGMMTGGAIPGYLLKQLLQQMTGKRIVYIYHRSTKKKTGHGEFDTGVRNNRFIQPGMHYVVVEELVNFGSTTCEGVAYERSQGRICDHAACFLSYENSAATKRLKAASIDLTSVAKLSDVLYYGKSKGYISKELCQSYLNFLHDPQVWHMQHGLQYFGADPLEVLD